MSARLISYFTINIIHNGSYYILVAIIIIIHAAARMSERSMESQDEFIMRRFEEEEIESVRKIKINRRC